MAGEAGEAASKSGDISDASYGDGASHFFLVAGGVVSPPLGAFALGEYLGGDHKC